MYFLLYFYDMAAAMRNSIIFFQNINFLLVTIYPDVITMVTIIIINQFNGRVRFVVSFWSVVNVALV